MVTYFQFFVFCVTVSCRLGGGYQIFEGMCCFYFQDKSDFLPEFGGRVLVSNHSSTSVFCVVSHYDLQMKRGIRTVNNPHTLQWFQRHYVTSNLFYLPTDAQLNCLKNSFEVYIKIEIKTVPTCIGVITIIRERTIRSCMWNLME
jgi:hypothetical protein